MPLDEVTARLYSAADAGTLLGLLPLLESQIERTKAEMKAIEGGYQHSVDSDAELAEKYGEILATLEARIRPDSNDREAFHALRDKVSSTLASLRPDEDSHSRYIDRLFRHLIDLTNRQRWIAEEMGRRGYLPILGSVDADDG